MAPPPNPAIADNKVTDANSNIPISVFIFGGHKLCKSSPLAINNSYNI